jgi:hypothetical protein
LKSERGLRRTTAATTPSDIENQTGAYRSPSFIEHREARESRYSVFMCGMSEREMHFLDIEKVETF